jgi:hypothetical protein
MTFTLLTNHVTSLSYDDLEREAYITDNRLALTICSKMEEIVKEAVDKALSTNDADYSYTIYDAIGNIQYLMKDAVWYKDVSIKDKLVYRIEGVHKDTNPSHNDIVLSRVPGSETWLLEVNGGEYGEDYFSTEFEVGGYKKAQERAVDILMEAVKMGLELNVNC